MKIKIVSRWNRETVIFETDAESIGDAIIAALAIHANLRDADLRGANLSGADLKKLLNQRTILPEGDLIGWKKLQNGVLCKLQIPAKAKRVGGLIGRKCRAEFAIVLGGEGKGLHNGHVYKVGETVKPDKYDPNPLLECSNGIHFFITKQEAQDHNS